MAKILLVEDDNNLREIYEARLQAEGYTIVSAQDGEEALVKAKQEKPDLVISDVMMPRISGFEMLDILRNTEGLKEAKVIMLTALGQAEDKTRADALGADRYLVKSQVTLEDIVRAADELLNGGQAPAAAAPEPVAEPAAAPQAQPTVAPMPVQAPPAEASTATSTPSTVAQPPVTPAPTPQPAVPTADVSPLAPVAAPVIPVQAPPAPTAAPAPAISMPTPAASAPTDTSAASQTAVPATPQATVSPVTAPPEPVAPVSAPDTAPAAPAQPSAPETPAAQPAAAAAEPITVPTPQTPAPAVPDNSSAAVTTSEPAPVDAASDVQKADDKLMADAMKELSATLEGDAKPDTPDTKDGPQTPEVASATDSSEVVQDDPQKTEPKIQATSAPVDDTVKPAISTTTTSETDQAAPTPAPAPEGAPASNPEKSAEAPSAPLAEPEAVAETAEAPQSEAASAIPDTSTSTNEPVTEPTSSPDLTAAQPSTAADEQALMQQQINDFINQQATGEPAPTPNDETGAANQGPAPTPAPTSPESPAPQTVEPDDVSKLLNDSAEPETSETPVTPPASDLEKNQQPTTTIQPTVASEPAPTPAPDTDTTEADSVAVAHKKVIQPPVEPVTAKPDLSELLAKEGVGLDDEPAVHPSGQFQTPHQPGHVISPNGSPQPGSGNPDDPNNIAL